MPEVELQWWRGCPSWEDAIALVREEMALAGLNPENLRVHEVRDEAEAEALDFPGSPRYWSTVVTSTIPAASRAA